MAFLFHNGRIVVLYFADNGNEWYTVQFDNVENEIELMFNKLLFVLFFVAHFKVQL